MVYIINIFKKQDNYLHVSVILFDNNKTIRKEIQCRNPKRPGTCGYKMK